MAPPSSTTFNQNDSEVSVQRESAWNVRNYLDLLYGLGYDQQHLEALRKNADNIRVEQFFCGGLFSEIPQSPNTHLISVEDARSQAETHVNTIFGARDKIRWILDHREGVLRKRWLNKSETKRAKILKAAWPKIPTRHRPDIKHALKFIRSGGDQLEVSAQDAPNYKWPHLNLEDLVQPKNLLLMLDARARNTPDVFVHMDRAFCKDDEIRGSSDAITTAWHPKLVMKLVGQVTVQTYGALVMADMEPQTYMQYLGGFHSACGLGLLILEIQQKIYDFLLECCYQIFGDIPRHKIDTESLPIREPLESFNTTNTTYHDLASHIAEIPYRAPATLDTKNLLTWIIAKRDAAEQHVWSLRSDPGYMNELLHERAAHSMENLLDSNRKRHQSYDTERFWKLMIQDALEDTYNDLLRWDALHEKAEALYRAVPDGFQTFDRLRPLPTNVQSLLLEILGHLAHYETWVARGFGNTVPLTRDFGVDCFRVDQASGVMSICFQSISAEKDELSPLLFQTFSEDKPAIKVLGWENVIDEVKHIIKNDPKQLCRFSAYIWEIFSNIAFATNITRLINAIHPWCESFCRRLPETMMSMTRCSQLTPDTELWRVFRGNFAKTWELEPWMPIKKSLAYPVEKAYNQANVSRLIASEDNLAAMWQTWDDVFHKGMGESLLDILRKHSKRSHVIQRTPPYHPRTTSRTPATTEAPPVDARIRAPDGQPARFVVETPRIKVKTRSSPSTTPDVVEALDALAIERAAAEEPAEPTFRLKPRALNVFRNLFHTGDLDQQMEEIGWKDFLHAMTKVGFAAEKLQGSDWIFTMEGADGDRAVHVHEPHPGHVMAPTKAMAIGRKLRSTYGWTAETFGEA